MAMVGSYAHAQVIKANWDKLVEKIVVTHTQLWDKMVGAIPLEDVTEMRGLPARDQIRALLERIYKGDWIMFKTFKEALRETGQKHIVTDFLEPKKGPGDSYKPPAKRKKMDPQEHLTQTTPGNQRQSLRGSPSICGTRSCTSSQQEQPAVKSSREMKETEDRKKSIEIDGSDLLEKPVNKSVLTTKTCKAIMKEEEFQDDQIKALAMSDGWLVIRSKTDEPTCLPMLSVEGFKKLTSEKNCESMTGLEISDVNIGYCYQQVFDFPFKCRNLHSLRLWRLKDQTTTNENIIEALATKLPSLSHLKEFDIRDTYLGQEGGHVLDALRCDKLRLLTVIGIKMIECGPKFVSCLERHALLAFLCLDNLGLPERELVDVLLCLPTNCPKIVGLSIDDNSLKDCGSELSKAEKRLSHLKFLSFENCQLNEKEVQSAILAAPTPIELISLAENAEITNVITVAVRSKLRLRFLHVHEGQIREPVLSQLRALMEKRGGVLHSGRQGEKGYKPIQDYINELATKCRKT